MIRIYPLMIEQNQRSSFLGFQSENLFKTEFSTVDASSTYIPSYAFIGFS